MRFLPFLVVLLFISSCASRKAGWESETKSVQLDSKELISLNKEARDLWEKRVETDQLQKALEVFERIHAANPSDLDTLIFLTRGNYFLADAHLQNMDEKKKVYERAAAWGEKAMATNEAFRKKVSSGAKVEEALDTLTEKEVPAIYWSAASLGKWAKASGIAAALKYKTRIKAMIERVEKLSPDYFFGAVPRYWGGFFAVAPSFAGGDMGKSKTNFDLSLAKAPEYLGTKVLMAEVYWTKAGNQKEFEKILQDVLSSQYDSHPEIGPENKWEKKKAQKLLSSKSDLF
jgi:tetratricopeptide (TPR) repeat protein